MINIRFLPNGHYFNCKRKQTTKKTFFFAPKNNFVWKIKTIYPKVQKQQSELCFTLFSQVLFLSVLHGIVKLIYLMRKYNKHISAA